MTILTMKSVISIFLRLGFVQCLHALASSIGTPVYPITASLFLDRTEVSEWNNALDRFQSQGGDTVWLEAPPLVRRSKQDLQEDPVFKWCREHDVLASEEVDCFTHAQQELSRQGLNIISFASYQYEEDFSKMIVKCPKYDRMITTVYTYFRIVLPGQYSSNPCDFNGMDVVVLFTSFGGSDAHEILLESATTRNVSVYFGMPQIPRTWEFGDIDRELLPAYFEWVRRILGDHKSRYSNKTITLDFANIEAPSKPIRIPLYKALKGYYISDDVNIGTVDRYGDMLMVYASLVAIAKLGVSGSLKLAVAPSIDLTTFGQNRTVDDHVAGFGYLVESSVDVIAVHEGRGYGKAAYYWPTQANHTVKSSDPLLDKIIQKINPTWRENGTFQEWFTGSVHELFQKLGNKATELRKQYTNLELWLGLEAFDDLNPVTAALVEDRFSLKEWNDTIDLFTEIGGDTLWKQAPPLIRRSIKDLQSDPVFKDCVDNGTDCFTHAQQELANKGLQILTFASYQNSEAYGDQVLYCPQYDKKITNKGITFYRIVLLADQVSSLCNVYQGENVMVLFTSLSGPDPHGLLLESAFARNVSVYMGMPRAPQTADQKMDVQLRTAYFAWVQRLLLDHKKRYTVGRLQHFSTIGGMRPLTKKFLYDTVEGYYISDDLPLGNPNVSASLLTAYSTLSNMARNLVKKRTAISPLVDLTSFGSNQTIQNHVEGLRILAKSAVDVIAINEGRGYGRAAYYWPTQEDIPVSQLDPSLDRILHRNNPNWRVNGTFREGFTGSIHELFRALGNETSFLNQNSSTFELWLGMNTFDDLSDDPCVTTPKSGHVMNTVSKSRIDLALAHAGFTVHKVVAFSWDPYFTCTTKKIRSFLADAILNDDDRPLMVDCRFHSPANRSVVILGINLLALQQGFTIDWPDRDGRRQTSDVHGYYFETDYGLDHGLIPTIIYTQTYDPYNVYDLADKGHVKVKAGGAYHNCIFQFDFTQASETPTE